MMMDSSPNISIIIPTYRRRDSIARCLRALQQQTLPAERYEVIVVVDGAEDGTRELVAEFRAPYQLQGIWQPNGGRAAAINQGLRAASGMLLILLDDDMEPAEGFVAAHWQAHRAAGRLGVMGAAPIILTKAAPPLVTHYIGPKFNQHLERLARPDHSLVLRDFYSGNFSVQRAVLLEVGGFDEAFKVYGNEDLELSYRLTRAGVRLAYCAEALAFQHYTKDFCALARDTIAKGQTAVLLASKHPETLPELQLSQYKGASFPWRLLRGAMLRLARHWPRVPLLVVATARALEPLAPGRWLRYRLTLDYCYWVGAEAALCENRRAGQGLRSLAGLSQSR